MSNLPWKLGSDNRISNNDGFTVADCRYVANQGRLIVQAVNAHEALVEALQNLVMTIKSSDTRTARISRSQLSKAIAALKLAGEHNAD